MRLRRAAVVLWLAADIGAAAWLAARRARGADEATRTALEERQWARAGTRLASAAHALGGLLIKVGQFLSTRVDIFPEAFTRPLTALQDVVPPVPWPAVHDALVAAYGPLDDPDCPLESVDRAPIAAASLAQVHRAQARDGRAMVLKVLRPGIAGLVDADLTTVRWVMGWAGRHTEWGRRYDLEAIAGEFADVTRQELDMAGEGRRAARFAAMFADDPRVHAPTVFADLARPGVLAMEEVSGVSPRRAALDAAGIDPAAVAAILLESYMRQWLSEGLFHADPHAGNLFVGPDASVTYVDFGMMAEIGPEDRAALQDLVLALVGRDPAGAAEAMDALGFLRPGVDRRPLERALAFLLRRMFDPRAGAMHARQTDELDELLHEIRAFLRQHPFQLPARYTFLGRALGMLAGIVADLRPDDPFVPALADAARRELARPGRRQEGVLGALRDVDWRGLAAAVVAWAGGDGAALARATELALPAWRRVSRGPTAVLRLMRRIESGRLVVTAPPAAPPPARGAAPTRAILAAGAGACAAIVGTGAPLARDLLWLAAAALAVWALAA